MGVGCVFRLKAPDWFDSLAGMNKTMMAMWVGIALLVVSWLFPPWKDYNAGAPEFRSFIHVPGWNTLNVGKLLLIDAILVTVTAGAMISLSRK